MPLLESPEVEIQGDKGGTLRQFFQRCLDITGYDLGENVLLGNVGLNTLCSSIVIQHLPVISNEPFLKASLLFTDTWNEMDDFIAEMNDVGTRVTKEPHPYRPGATNLLISGLDNIYAVGAALRDRYSHSQLEVDQLLRPVIHPELLGEMLDDLSSYATDEKLNKNSFHYAAYRHDWVA